MHYLIQTTLAALKNATRDTFDGVDSWVKAWQVVNAKQFVGHYSAGMAVISGPATVGNPNRQWWEIQCSVPELVTDLDAIADMRPMREELLDNPALRAQYRAMGRTLILNQGGGIVGLLPAFEINGRGLVGSFMAGADIETAQVMSDLEPQ